MKDDEIKKIFEEWLKKESEANIEKCFWMSFCDPDKEKGQQFLGVIITKALGFAHAVDKSWALGINPGGEIMAYETDPTGINPDHFDKLLSRDELIAYGYCDS